jgi:hypothetical protein
MPQKPWRDLHSASPLSPNPCSLQSRFRSVISPATSASFFARVQCFSCRSRRNAASRLVQRSAYTIATGRLAAVNVHALPSLCLNNRITRSFVSPTYSESSAQRSMYTLCNTRRRCHRAEVLGAGRRGNRRPSVCDRYGSGSRHGLTPLLAAESAGWTGGKQQLTATRLPELLVGEGHQVVSDAADVLRARLRVDRRTPGRDQFS